MNRVTVVDLEPPEWAGMKTIGPPDKLGFEELTIKSYRVPLKKSDRLLYHNFRFSKDASRLIRNLVKENNYDAIYAVSSAAYYVRSFSQDARIIVDVCDADPLQIKRYLSLERSPWKRGKLLAKHLMWLAYKRMVLSRFKDIVVVSQADAKSLGSYLPNQEIHVIPNGVDSEYFKPLEGLGEEENVIIFTGAMGATHNEQAIMYFVDKIFKPLIVKENPGARLRIVGANPSSRIKELGREPSIECMGYVEDMRSQLARAAVYVAPFVSGSGIKNKVLEAMAMGKPVVSTRMGCEALKVDHGEDILVADEPMQFGEYVAKLLSDAEARREIGRKARKKVLKEYSWERHAASLSVLMEEMIQR